MIEDMIAEYNEPLVKALVETIEEKTNVSYIEAAEIVLAAWQRSKGQWLADARSFKRVARDEAMLVH
jgi:hypothetical protein